MPFPALHSETSGFCSCCYGLWFKLGKFVQAALTGAFPPKSRTQHLTYFASPTPVSSEHWAVFSFPPPARLGSLALIIILREQRGGGGDRVGFRWQEPHLWNASAQRPRFPQRNPATPGLAATPASVLGSLWCNPPDNTEHSSQPQSQKPTQGQAHSEQVKTFFSKR